MVGVKETEMAWMYDEDLDTKGAYKYPKNCLGCLSRKKWPFQCGHVEELIRNLKIDDKAKCDYRATL